MMFSVTHLIRSFRFFLILNINSLVAIEQLTNTSDSLSKETINLLLQMINDLTPGNDTSHPFREKKPPLRFDP